MNTQSPSIILSLLCLSLPVAAQDTQDSQTPDPITPLTIDQLDTTIRLKPVVVTARRWTEFVQDVPQSITVIDGDTIRDAGLRSIREASFLVPNLHMTEFTSRRLSFPTIRGISTGVGDPSVTTYIDGVPQLAISSTNISLLDVDRIEFLRGPQGTLYGRNSIGGLIKIETARPSNTPTLRTSTTWGDYDLQEHSLSFSGPIVKDKWYISVSGLYSERDGYTKNDVTGNRVDDRRSTFGRGKLLFTPDDQNEFSFTYYGERSRDGGFALGFLEAQSFDLNGTAIDSDPHHINVDFEGSADRDIGSYALTWNHYGDSFDITSVSAYVDWDISEESDFDFTSFDSVRRFTDESQEYFYQELRVSSPHDDPVELDERHSLKWLVGGTVFSSDGERSATNEFRAIPPPGFSPGDSATDAGDFDDLGIAVFGQATLSIDETVDLTAGLRYDYEDKEADITNDLTFGGFPFPTTFRSEDESYDEFAPNFSAAVHMTDNAMLYGRAAKGFKAGGFNFSAPTGKGSFDTETSWTYEAGIKSTWLDDRLMLNVALFYIDWDDLQLSLFDPATGGFTDNAGEASSQGIELELRVKVTKNIELFAGFGYTDAEFDEFTDSFFQDNSGNNLAFVPETTLNA
ncbi:MAG: TonB-dependent receptor, partial [Planctomycetota bacterium]|nr:TonB-dependent receptor [Planctomycetota bacterium]